MSIGPFRFIHASDFHLEQPPTGLLEIPDHLREVLIDAPLNGAHEVFEAAVSDAVDFVVLAGDILDPLAAGPRGVAFLLQHFEQLEEHDIRVYWAPGKVDALDRWPGSVSFPDNVRMFESAELEEIIHYREEEPLATLAGSAGEGSRGVHAAAYQHVSPGSFTIGVAFGRADADQLTRCPIDYWALGGQHRRETLFTSPGTAHYPGTVQGRNPDETGAHGYTVVNVDDGGRCRLQAITSDSLRWHEESVEVEDSIAAEDLEILLADRLQRLSTSLTGQHMLVSLRVNGARSLAAKLRYGGLAEELVASLQREYGQGDPSVWTIGLSCDTSEHIPSGWFEEDTILGDYLRAVQEFQQDDSRPLDLQPLLGERRRDPLFRSAVDVSTNDARRRLLDEAAALGADLLRGGEGERD